MSDPEALYDFGRYLQHQRRSQQITLEDVSLHTKIRIVVLKQIENEDLSHLPEPTITKGFIRAFAQAVGCDLNEAVKRYEARLAADFQANQAQNSSEEAPTPFWRRILPVLILFALLVALVFYFSDRLDKATKAPHLTTPLLEPEKIETRMPQNIEGESAKETPQTPVIDQTPQPQTQPAPSVDTDTAPEPQADSVGIQPDISPTQTPIKEDVDLSAEPTLDAETQGNGSQPLPIEDIRTLTITAVERTWFRVTIDKNTSKELILSPGERAVFKAHETFELLVGNAAGLQIELDGQQVPVQGKSGKVISLTLP